MPEEVKVVPNGGGDFVIRLGTSGDELVLTAGQAVELANVLAPMARKLMLGASGPSSDVREFPALHVRKLSVQHDIIGENVLIEILDTEGSESAIELSIAQARRLAISLLECCDRASATLPNTRQ